MHPLIGLVTVATVLLLAALVAIVARARGRYGVRAPATTGHDLFERAFRVQGNTNEAALMFLPALWTAAAFGRPALAAGFGALWLLGRIVYAVTYLDPAKKRAFGFALSSVATLLLVAQALWGIGWTLAGTGA
jgi:glutathione S-transferase